MFQTMTQIGHEYNVDAKSVGKILYQLKIRDPEHAVQKGFPFEQAVTHGIAKAFEGRNGETYYRYDIQTVKEEFEKLLAPLLERSDDSGKKAQPQRSSKEITVEAKLQQMLDLLNETLKNGEISQLYRLKADIADIYALLPK